MSARLERHRRASLLIDVLVRKNFTFDDALYVALARRLDEPLATTDARLTRAAAGVGVAVVSPG